MTTMTRASVDTAPSCSIVICAYTDDRWDLLLKGYQASIDQLHARDQVIVVIDHNAELFSRAATDLPDALVIQNEGPKGLSGGRNTGVSAASGDIVVFLDDDACPADGWLRAYRTAFGAEDVAVVAGSIEPYWVGGRKPSWFPDEFGWVVGCDYRGLPGDQHRVRNPIGANMAIRRDIIDAVGGFSSAVGRVGTKPIGNEETDLSIRINQAKPDLRTIRVTSARVDHVVPGSRQTWKYFLSRCFYEGRSKRILAGRVGTGDGLDSERRYVTRTLPSGFARELLGLFSGKSAGPGRALAIALGLLATAAGYLSGREASADGAASPTAGAIQAWRPLRVVEYDLDAGQPAVEPTVCTERLRLLVLAHGSPVGFLDVEEAEGVPAALEVARRVGYDGAVHAAVAPSPAQRFMADPDAPMVSVVIATRGRTSELTGCLDSVLAQQYPNFEVIIVDNNDDPRRLQELLEDHFTDDRLRIVHESRRGVSVARDRGTREARGVLIAATDDDVVVPSNWLPELVAAFDDTSVDCVTGLVVANGFKTPAQELFEEFGGFSKGFEPARYDLGEHRAPEVLYPFSPGVYGSGNNVAFRKEALEAVGGYDRRLGPGTLVKSGEDLDLFLKFLFDGRTLVYQPRARVSHSHRQTMDELHVQIRHYGRGLSAVILKWALSDPRRLADIVRRLPAGLSRLLNSNSDRNRGRSASYPASLRRAELRGLVEGSLLLPVQAIRARRQR